MTSLGMAVRSGRAARRDDIGAGLRLTSSARGVAIAFDIESETVTIDRILYARGTLGKAGGAGLD